MAFSSAALRHTLSGLEHSNISLDQLLNGIVEESVLGQDFWLADADYFEIIRRAMELSVDPAIGLAVGQREGNWLELGAVGLHVSFVRSFSHAVRAFLRFQVLLRDRQDMFAVQDENSLTILFVPFEGPLPVRRFLVEAGLSSMKSLLARYAGPDTRPLSVLLDYPAPSHADEYRKLFGCDVRFEQRCSALVVPRGLAEHQQVTYQRELAEHLAQLAEERFTWAQHPPFIAEEVRSLLHVGSSNRLSMSAVARRLGLSERSLRRKLSEEGVKFRTILAAGRCELATRLLRTGMSVKAVAQEVGYRSSSAFQRAFRRWSGASPSDFAARAHGSAVGQLDNVLIPHRVVASS